MKIGFLNAFIKCSKVQRKILNQRKELIERLKKHLNVKPKIERVNNWKPKRLSGSGSE